MSKILIVEDEKKIARFVELELKHEGYETEWAGNGKDGLQKILENCFDLIILDVMLPELDGIEVCSKARKEGIRTPIIMLTAKDDVMDKVTGLDNGADDYMTKPFAIEELLARIRVAIHRQQSVEGANKQSHIMEYGDLRVDMAKHEASYLGNKLLFTKKEFDLVAYLLTHKNEAISRERILNEVWNYEYMGETNVVDVYVRYVRQKLDDVYGVKIINTVRGVGYIIKDE